MSGPREIFNVAGLALVASNDGPEFALGSTRAAFALNYTKGAETNIAVKLFHLGLDEGWYVLKDGGGTDLSLFGTVSATGKQIRNVLPSAGAYFLMPKGIWRVQVSLTGSSDSASAVRIELVESGT